jgi:hypothetical protein
MIPAERLSLIARSRADLCETSNGNAPPASVGADGALVRPRISDTRQHRVSDFPWLISGERMRLGGRCAR